MSADTGPAVPTFRWLARLDLRVLGPALVLVLLGLVSLASSRPDLLATQIGGCLVGLAVLGVVLTLPYRTLLALAWPAYALSLLLLVLVLLPGVGTGPRGVQRWLSLAGVRFQPSELARVAHVLVLARYIRFRRDHRTFRGLVAPFLLTLVPMALIVKEPDLGTALLMIPVLFGMLWVAGARTKHLVAVVGLGVASLPIFYLSLADYQRARIHAFVPALERFAPAEAEPATPGPAGSSRAGAPPAYDDFQVTQARYAIAGGGVTGQGWREGRQNRARRPPENWTDFIFTVHAEEWGLVGVLLLLLAEAGLLLGLATLAVELREPAGRLLCAGAMILLGTQALFNLLMTMGLAPVSGAPLPFLSYGRSAMLCTWLLLGMALNARAREPVVFSSRDFD